MRILVSETDKTTFARLCMLARYLFPPSDSLLPTANTDLVLPLACCLQNAPEIRIMPALVLSLDRPLVSAASLTILIPYPPSRQRRTLGLIQTRPRSAKGVIPTMVKCLRTTVDGGGLKRKRGNESSASAANVVIPSGRTAVEYAGLNRRRVGHDPTRGHWCLRTFLPVDTRRIDPLRRKKAVRKRVSRLRLLVSASVIATPRMPVVVLGSRL